MTKLGYEILAETLNDRQAALLGILCAKADAAKLVTACRKAGCSWDDGLALNDLNLIAVQAKTNKRKASAVATELGRLVSDAVRFVNERQV